MLKVGEIWGLSLSFALIGRFYGFYTFRVAQEPKKIMKRDLELADASACNIRVCFVYLDLWVQAVASLKSRSSRVLR